MKSIVFLFAVFTTELQVHCLFQQQSTIVLSSQGLEYSPNDQTTLLLFTIESRLLSFCAHKCLLITNCRIFNYDFQSRQCRLYGTDDDYSRSIINSSSTQSVVGSIQTTMEEFNNYGRSCSFCLYSLQLKCINSTCQCQSHSYYDGSICRTQRLNGGECNDTIQCRNDLNLICLPNFRCGQSLNNLSFDTTEMITTVQSTMTAPVISSSTLF